HDVAGGTVRVVPGYAPAPALGIPQAPAAVSANMGFNNATWDPMRVGPAQGANITTAVLANGVQRTAALGHVWNGSAWAPTNAAPNGVQRSLPALPQFSDDAFVPNICTRVNVAAGSVG